MKRNIPPVGRREDKTVIPSTTIGFSEYKSYYGVAHHVRKLAIYGKNGKRNIEKKSRRLVSKAEDLLSFAVESVDFSLMYSKVRA